MRAFSPYLPPAKRVARWFPALLTSNIQWGLDSSRDTQYYAPSTLNNLPVLKPLETYGTFRAPRAGWRWLFDGSNDYARLASAITLTGQFTLSLWFERSSTATTVAIVGNSTNFANLVWIPNDSQLYLSNNAGSGVTFDVPSMSANTAYHVVFTRDGSNNVRCYINGTESTSGAQSLSGSFIWDELGCRFDTASHFPGSLWDVRVYNVSKNATEAAAIYNQHLTPETIDSTGIVGGWWCNEESGLTGYDWSGNGRNLTLTNITQATFHAAASVIKYNPANWVGYTLSGSVIKPRNEADTAKDVSGAALGNTGRCPHPVVVETPCITFDGSAVHLTDNDLAGAFTGSAEFSVFIRYSRAAGAYGTLLACERFRLVTTGAGVLGVDFTDGVSGLSLYGTTESADSGWHTAALVSASASQKIYLDGVVDATSATAGESRPVSTVKIGYDDVSGIGSTSPFPGAMAGVYVFAKALTANEVTWLHTNGTAGTDPGAFYAFLPMQDGPGDSNTNRTVRDVSGSGRNATIISGTVATIWGTRCPGYAKDWSIQYGGRMSSGVFIPGNVSGSNCVDGVAKGLSAGKHGNANSRIVPNYWSAPELVNIGSTSSDKYAPGYDVQSESVADTRYRRTAASGDDRLLAFSAALSGTNKVKAQTYTT